MKKIKAMMMLDDGRITLQYVDNYFSEPLEPDTIVSKLNPCEWEAYLSCLYKPNEWVQVS